MAYLNEQQRLDLLNELKDLSYNQAHGRLKRTDPSNSRLVYYRNAQYTGEWHTRYELAGLGTIVTLIEKYNPKPTARPDRVKNEFDFMEVVVEPTPDNHS